MQSSIKTLQIIHLALVAGVTIAYVIVGRLHTLNFLKLPEMNNTALLLMLGAAAAVLLSHVLYKQQLRQISKTASFQEQFNIYQTATIMRLSVLEGVAFLMLFLQKDLLIVGLILIVYMLLLRPSEVRMKNDLDNNRFI